MSRPQLVVVLAAALAPLVAGPGQAQPLDLTVQPALAPALGDAPLGPDRASTVDERARSGVFTTLIYNIAGIPQFASDVEPRRNTPLIGPLLNGYDLVLVQEDFMYHEELAVGARHPFPSPPYPVPASFMTLGDGLSHFSQFPLGGFERHEWSVCSGLFGGMFDCTARKGFTFARMTLAAGVMVDVYNLHLDAGRDEDDQAARTVQTGELIAAALERSSGRAVIVAGDTNLRGLPSDLANLERLLVELALTDSCAELRCGGQHIDRVFFRSGGGVELRALDYRVPAEFVDGDGLPLSDHVPVAVTFDWAAVPEGVAAE